MRFFITGIGGFAAAHLAELLLRRGHAVSGLLHRAEIPHHLADLMRRFDCFDAGDLAVGDVRDEEIVGAALRRFRPDGLFHLAAQSSVDSGEGQGASTFSVNAVGTLHLLGVVRREAKTCRVLVAGSGEAYGRSAGETAVDESRPLRPMTVYGASKAAAELVARQAADGYGMDVLCVRAFNQTGPGQSPRFVCADFARQVVSVERGEADGMSVGNLEAVRDFLDVRDAVRAYLSIWERGARGGVYNTSSGVGRRIAEIADSLRARARREIPLRVDPARVRPVDLPALIGKNEAIRALGWEPEYAWDHTLDDVLADWRAR